MEFRFELSRQVLGRLNTELENAKRLNNLRLYRTVQSFIWIGEGIPVAEVSCRLRISSQSIYNWLWKFLLEGFSWLLGKHYQGRGRKSKLSKHQRTELYSMIVAGPEANGFNCGVWNSALITELIFARFGVKYNPRYLCSLLKKLGLSFQKAKFISDKVGEEEYEQARLQWRKETWPAILKTARKKNAVILFADEASFAWWGSLARTWAPKGQQPVVRTTGRRRGMKIFGAIEFQSGKFIYMETPEKFNGESYLQFLKKISAVYKCPVILIEDGAPYHKNALVREFTDRMRQKGLFYVYRLPSFSPDLNPIEKLWKNTKKEATHLKYFKTFEDLRKSVLGVFKTFLQCAKKVIKVMKKLRSTCEIYNFADSFSEN